MNTLFVKKAIISVNAKVRTMDIRKLKTNTEDMEQIE